MRTPEFQAAVVAELQKKLEDDTASLVRIRGVAQAALDISEAYPEEVTEDAQETFARQYPEAKAAIEKPS
ncbi:hypothetical protein HY478_03740 [Candidatus Uhrbacteria bacterium]|nr:hypothetical protein [Candidatus Uhrbacteria bacterium]